MFNEKVIREDFERRLVSAKESFERNKECPVTKKLLELNELNSTALYSLFMKTGTVSFGSLEGVELFNSIVGNFYDDSYFMVIWEVPSSVKSMRERCGLKVTDDDREPHITWTFDEGIDEAQFIEIIQFRIDKEIKRLKLHKKLEAMREN